jgi:lipoprotein-anchoring transpeptidase ErfK/SrfK
VDTFAVEVNRSKFEVLVWRLKQQKEQDEDWEDRLGLWKRHRRYDVAVGAIGYTTPVGLYYIASKALNPDWRMPNSKWVPEKDRGKLVPGGAPENPLKAAFLALGGRPIDGIGFHGTDDFGSIGTAASHGCIRMTEEDVLDFYELVEIGTLAFIY